MVGGSLESKDRERIRMRWPNIRRTPVLGRPPPPVAHRFHRCKLGQHVELKQC